MKLKQDQLAVIALVVIVVVGVVWGLRARAQPVSGQVASKMQITYADGSTTMVDGTNKLQLWISNLLPQTITEKNTGKEVKKINMYVYSYANWEGPMVDWDVTGEVKVLLTDPAGNTATKFSGQVMPPSELKKGEWQLYNSLDMNDEDIEAWCSQDGQYTLTLWIGLQLDIWFEDGQHDSRQASGRSMSWLFIYDAGQNVPYQITNWDPQPRINPYY